MIDGVAGRPFSANTIPPWGGESEKVKEKIIRTSGDRYGADRKLVEEKLKRWLGEFESSSEGTERDVYDAQCSSCAKKTKVPFLPDGNRPTYCKACRKKMKNQEEIKVSLKEALNPSKDDKERDMNKLKEALREALKKK